MADILDIEFNTNKPINIPNGDKAATINRLLGRTPISATFSPGSGAHIAGDAIGAEATFTGLFEANRPHRIEGISMEIWKSGAAITLPTVTFSLWLLNATTSTSYSDDDPWGIKAADNQGKIICEIPIPVPKWAGISGTAEVAWITGAGLVLPVLPTTANPKGRLVVNGGFTPAASSVHTVTVFVSPL
jgi:hypothetical protein